MGRRILVIEDDPASLELMTYLLTAFGHRPVAARNGEEGIEVAMRGGVDLVLCDLALPILDGYAVVRRLKADSRLASVPVIAVTASAMVGDRDKVIAMGFDGYISKPITPETFVAEMESHLRKEAANGDDPDR